ncbi:MAG: tetratricopeptide repeat protein [Planctomycetaceae bacterium]
MSSPSPKKRRRRSIVMAIVAIAVIAAAIAWPSWKAGQPESRYARGLQAYEAGDLKTLRIEGLALKNTADWQAQASLLTGMFELARGQLPEAVAELEAARADESTRVAAWRLTGETFHRAGQLDEARRAFQDALAFDPDDVASHRWMAATLYDLGAMALALAHLDEVKRLDPDDPRPYRFAGAIHKDYEHYPDAIAEYRQGLKHHPSQILADEMRFELAECLFETGDYDEAVRVLSECRTSADTDALRGRCQSALGNSEAALQLADSVLKSAPQHVEALKLKASILMERREYSEAESLLERAAEVNSADPALYVQLSQLYQLQGKTDQADATAKKMKHISDLRTQLAELHSQALSDVTNADLRFQIGQTADELGMHEIAAMWFKAALSLDPQHVQAGNALADHAGKNSARQNSGLRFSRPDGR